MIFYFISMIEDEDDRQLAERLYFDYRQVIYNTAFGYLKDEFRAEDAVCDVFERICRNIYQFRELDKEKTRLLLIVYSRNVCRNILRRDKIIEFEELDEGLNTAAHQTERTVLERDTYERILKLVESLDAKYADVCKLKFFIGMENAEIAKALDISGENVRVRLSRSREKIRDMLGKEISAI